MNKIKSNLKKCLAYVVSRRLLKYSLIIVLFILPVGTALINKYFYNKETIKHELVESPNNKNNGVGTIRLEGIAGPKDMDQVGNVSNDTGVAETFELVFQIKKN